MTQTALTAAQLPRTMAEFADWKPNDGEMIKFIGVQQQQWYVYEILNGHFILKNYHKLGTLMAELDVMLSGIQMRRPDIAYFTKEQIKQGRVNQENVIPEFATEAISTGAALYRCQI